MVDSILGSCCEHETLFLAGQEEVARLHDQLEGERLDHQQVHAGCHAERDEIAGQLARLQRALLLQKAELAQCHEVIRNLRGGR